MTLEESMSLPPEKAEEAYRRGYRDGYIAALLAVYGKREIPEKHWNHWEETLFDWERADASAMVLPPAFINQRENQTQKRRKHDNNRHTREI